MSRTLLWHKIILTGSLGFVVSCFGFFYFAETYSYLMVGFIIATVLYYFFYDKLGLARIFLIALTTLSSIYLALARSTESFSKYSIAIKNVSIIKFTDIKPNIIRARRIGFEYEYILWLDQYKTFALLRTKDMIEGKPLVMSGKLAPLASEPSFNYYYIQNILFRVVDFVFKDDDIITNNSKFNVLSLRNNLSRVIDFYVSYPQSEFLKSILFNERDNFPKYLRTIFKETNTYHIFAISGQHIAIFTIIFIRLLIIFGLNRKYSLLFSSVFMFIYVLVVGAPIPAVRALLFNFLAVAGFFSSRKIDFKKLLLYIAVVFLFFQPHLIKYDLSFIFSFGSSLGLIIFSEPLSYFLYRRSAEFRLKFIFDSLIGTLAASILIAPLNLYYWHSFNLLGIFINVLVLMLIPFILFLGIMIVWIWWLHSLMLIWSFVLERLVTVVIWLTQILNQVVVLKLSFEPSVWHLTIYYLIVGLLLYGWELYRKKYVL